LGKFFPCLFIIIILSSISLPNTLCSVAVFGLSNGGTAGLIYVYIGTFIGMAAVVVSMAEMGSMYAQPLFTFPE
jgi:hypothetical protein